MNAEERIKERERARNLFQAAASNPASHVINAATTANALTMIGIEELLEEINDRLRRIELAVRTED